MPSLSSQSIHPIVRARDTVWRVLVIYLALTGAFILLIALLAIAVVVGPTGGTPGQDQIVRRADPQFVWPWSSQVVGGTLAVNSMLSPPCPPPGPGQPVVAIAIDTSRSMQGAPLTAAADAAKQIAEAINLTSFRVGAVTFADTVTTVQTPIGKVDQLLTTLGNLPVGKDSSIAAGVEQASAMIDGVSLPTFTTVILISDGIGEVGNLARLTADLKTRGVRIVTMPIGPLADTALLQRIASTPSDMILPGSPDFERFLNDYRVDLGTVVGRDLVLTEQYEHAAFSPLATQPPASGSLDPQIVWRTYFVNAQPLTYTYTLDAQRFGLYALAPAGGLAYTDCSGNPVTVSTPAGPLVLVLPPWLLWLLLPLILLLITWLVLNFWPLAKGAVPAISLPFPPDPITPLPALVPPLDPVLIRAPYGRASPTLVIGLGGSGEAVLQHIHRNVWELTPDASLPDRLLMLSIDIEQPERDQHLQDNLLEPLPQDERLLLSLNVGELAHQYERNHDRYPHLDEWLRIESDVSAGTYRATVDQSGQRQYGRLVLFEHLKEGLASGLITAAIADRLRRLNELAEQGEPIRIFIVSSLAGGFSSGVLVDLAHIVRKAADQIMPGTANYMLQPILMPGGAFQSLTPARRLRTNTVATLREIDRLMTMSNRQFPMVYTADDYQHRPEKNMLDTLLFDFAFIVDATRNDRSFANRSPHETLYPAVADAIMLLMDNQAHANLTTYYDSVRPNIRQEQQETTRAVLNSFGVFSYRVPMRLVAELLEWQIMRSLVEIFFGIRSDSDGGTPRFNPILPEEQINEMAIFFFERGERDFDKPEQGPSLRALGALAAVARQSGFRPEQIERDLCIDPSNPPSGDAEVRKYVGQFTIYLQQFVHGRLNGSAHDEQRFGRLTETITLLRRIAAVISQAHGRISSDSKAGSFARSVLDGWRIQVEAVSIEIENWSKSAIGTQGVEGLHQNISVAEQHVRGQIESLRTTVFRRYLFDEYLPELTARLQRQAIDHVTRFFWLVEVDRERDWKTRVGLGLVSTTATIPAGDSQPVRGATMLTRATDTPKVTVPQALRDLAHTLVAPVWQEPIYAWLTRSQTEIGQPRALAEQILRDTAPLLRFDQLDAPNVLKTRFLAIMRPDNTPDSTSYQHALVERLRAEAVRRNDLQTIDLTNRFNCIFLSTVNVLPIDTTLPYSPIGQYREEYASLTPRDLVSLHVLAPEQMAVRYESRLTSELDVQHHLLHPRVVALLTNPSALDLLALSYAHNQLFQRGNHWYLQLDGQAELQLTSDDLGSTLLDACDQFILGKPRRGLAHALMFDRGRLKELHTSLRGTHMPAAHTAQIDQALRGLHRIYAEQTGRRLPSPRERMGTQMYEDLSLLLMLVLHDLRTSISILG